MDDRSQDRDATEPTTTTDSGLIDLRALAACAPAQDLAAREEARDAVIHTMSTWHALAPVAPSPIPEPRAARSVTGVLAAATVLSLSMVAFAALPRIVDRDARVTGEATGERSHVVAPRPEVSEPVEVTEPIAEPSVSIEEPSITPVLERPTAPSPTPRPRVAVVPRATRTIQPTAPERAPSTELSDAAIDPALASLIDQALTGGTRAATAPALPATPSQREVSTTLRALERSVAMCREGDGEMVSTRIVIDGATGRVTRVDVSGLAAPGAEATCITRALQTAQFSPFSREQFVVSYPFRV